ncbi:hypothetical protein A2W67_01875 [Candidatus Nomurabacteria bacterium RIFCSPLOWO2_02_40_28]|uniref:Uncharacterized protein n=2 Tax=Candidatus Nomuraibacteriota TaxID=1752729 RepID=A0A837HTM4_9BACT|nr:MAG: hypothetical protein UT27_C0005G0026 [Candidatus Nomurabacteria bacterium GW2011_GWD2_39_12]KKR20292.1 MAG: hypothetical protein UT51_C0005G0025 [Candidatus Nomurabacteria bacterium GW2011_GWC2_39_41]KKR36538.1 MAG: hypothetical protein UT70_C0010G0025 [Candidatus Nomurabacteria bacterium GW2011_GWE2_40_10]KKR38385.1 MAG: hypothetical protein UT73_C0003G0025 [Candidatus Nomurabacteria bacterium GW2011_GWB1_40_11]KKR39884.1 MAG: hypothetical protein UT74_C0005G0101 [Parcubacteria group b
MQKQTINIAPHTPIHLSLKKGDYLAIQTFTPVSGLLIDVKNITKDEVTLQFLNSKPNPEISDIALRIVKGDYKL